MKTGKKLKKKEKYWIQMKIWIKAKRKNQIKKT